MQPVYTTVSYASLINSATEWELRAICRYADKLPPPMLDDRRLLTLYTAIWEKNRVDLLLQACGRIDLPAYFFVDWPQSVQLQVIDAFACDPDAMDIVLKKYMQTDCIRQVIKVCLERRAVRLAAKVFPKISDEIFFQHVHTLPHAVAVLTKADWRQLKRELQPLNGLESKKLKAFIYEQNTRSAL